MYARERRLLESFLKTLGGKGSSSTYPGAKVEHIRAENVGTFVGKADPEKDAEGSSFKADDCAKYSSTIYSVTISGIIQVEGSHCVGAL